jgi:hypothetical protein
MSDKRDKLVFMKAWNSILLNNKCCRSTRKQHKRRTSKAIRQDVRQRRVEL